MPWNIDRSRERIARVAGAIPEIRISDLTREMTLENVKLAEPKRIVGVHSYVDLANEQRLVDDLLDVEDHDAAKRAARMLHLYQRAVGRTADAFGAAQVHFQGSRLHSVIYRPFSDHREIAARSVAMALAADLVIRRALNPALKDDPDLGLSAGASYGETLATMSGSRGDSELLFIGDAANDGAKAIASGCAMRITGDLLDLLDCEELGIEVSEQVDGFHSVAMSQTAIEEIAERFGIAWTLERAGRQVSADVEAITLDSFGVTKATAEIDKDRLGPSNTKLSRAITIFGDLDGFTATVAGAMGDDIRLARLVRDFHIMRAEMRHIAVTDYDPTLRVQYQGDRIQLLRHLPHDDDGKRALRAVQIATAWNSALTHTLPGVVELDSPAVATGIADGPTLVSKLGTRGNRDIVTIGAGVRRAERIQRNLDGGEIGVDGVTLELLPNDVQQMFDWRPGAQGHVCVDRDINDIELALRAESYDADAPQSVLGTAAKVAVGAAAVALVGSAARAAGRGKDAPTSPHGNPDQGHGGSGGQGGGHGGGHGGHGRHGGGNGGGHGGHGRHGGGNGGHGGDVVPGRRWAS